MLTIAFAMKISPCDVDIGVVVEGQGSGGDASGCYICPNGFPQLPGCPFYVKDCLG